jgi:hypothetical protein
MVDETTVVALRRSRWAPRAGSAGRPLDLSRHGRLLGKRWSTDRGDRPELGLGGGRGSGARLPAAHRGQPERVAPNLRQSMGRPAVDGSELASMAAGHHWRGVAPSRGCLTFPPIDSCGSPHLSAVHSPGGGTRIDLTTEGAPRRNAGTGGTPENRLPRGGGSFARGHLGVRRQDGC